MRFCGYIFVFAMLLGASWHSRAFAGDFNDIDSYLASMSLEGKPSASIARHITGQIRSDRQKAYAIYSWTAQHIRYDFTAAERGKRSDNKRLSEILDKRKTDSFGFALLFDELMNRADLQAQIVTGYVKQPDQTLWQLGDKPRVQAWNVAYLENKWRLIDVTFASNRMDNYRKNDKIAVDQGWFDVAPEIFATSHQPFDENWQRTERGTVSLKQFRSLPFIHPNFGKLGFTLQGASVTLPPQADSSGFVEFRMKGPKDYEIWPLAYYPVEQNRVRAAEEHLAKHTRKPVKDMYFAFETDNNAHIAAIRFTKPGDYMVDLVAVKRNNPQLTYNLGTFAMAVPTVSRFWQQASYP